MTGRGSTASSSSATKAARYYASEQKLTIENAACVLRCLTSGPDGAERVVGRIVEISTSGRAPKNDAAVFALALVRVQGAAQPAAVRLALDALPRVCRIGTHLFQFVAACRDCVAGAARLRRAVADWYLTGRRTPSRTRSSSTSSVTAGRTATCCA